MARRSVKQSEAGHRRKQKSKAKPQEHLLSKVTPQRQIEIFAILLVLVGLLTLISLFTQSSNQLTAWWVKNLSVLVGWGVFILPLAIILIGLWVLFKNLERIPKLSLVRIFGILLLFVNLTTWFHLIVDGSFLDARAGQGGGYLGAAFKIGFVQLLGKPGAIVALIAWLLVSLMLTLDLAMANIVKWAAEWVTQLARFISQTGNKALSSIHSRWNARKQAKQPEKPTLVAESSQRLSSPAITPIDPTTATNQAATQEDPPQEPVWVLPNPEEILNPAIEPPDDSENDRHRARVIEETLRSFGAPARVVEIKRGPSVTLFGVEPDFVASRNGRTKVRVSKIVALADDIALALAAARIRIQAPVPGKGYIGIEVPNQQISIVALQEVLLSPSYQQLNSPLKIALGKDMSGHPVAADLTALPHLLIAGTTGAGKSVCINGILSCFLLNKTPDELRLVLVDPKRVELTGYNGIPHLLSPVIVEAEQVVGALQWMLREMENRYRKFAEVSARNITEFNRYCDENQAKKIPYLIVVIDELSDLMMLAPDETERSLTRLAQLSRATGIHLIIATQRPSTDILTGLIKANFPARIAFAVASSVDSRVILDQPGAERLLGNGDMLFQAPDAPAPVRIQGAYVSDAELNRLAAYWRGFSVSTGAPERPDQPVAFQSRSGVSFQQTALWEDVDSDQDEKYIEALEIIRTEGYASTSMLQRKLRVGYTRAARLIDQMEEDGIIGPPDPRTQLRSLLETEEDQ
ncbi:MAG: DNA translocase FtsK [Chloroflexi bacterium]|nr:DNA translocase FtsK [Chloroflexota bacterium]